VLIDWFTVVAQAVNFLVLAWILKHFLYAPVMEAMRSRRERIAKKMEGAETMRRQAEEQARELSAKRAQLDQQAEAMLDQVRKDADERREQWLAEAKADVEERSRMWLEGVERERAGLSGRLRTRMAEQAISLAEKVLRDLAGEQLETHALEHFIKRLDDVSSETPLAGKVVIRTGFPLSSEALNRFRRRLDERFPRCTGMEAIRDESLGFGIVMVGDNLKLEWNMASYLDSVEEAVFAELTQTKAET
jgi:F-type H+-transporting ATPase subunit b